MWKKQRVVLGLMVYWSFTGISIAQTEEIWSYGCNEQLRCHVVANMGGIRVAFAKEKDDAGLKAAVVVPSSVLKDSPITIRLDSGVEMRLTTTVCNQQFCEARIDAQKALLVVQQLKKADRATIGYLMGDAIQMVSLPLNGFVETFQTLDNEIQDQVRDRIRSKIEYWATSWANGDLDSYINTYASGYKSRDSLSRSGWISDRRDKVRKDRDIKLDLNGLNIDLDGGFTKATATFTQLYKSNGYSDSSKKSLTFHNTLAGWKIVDEKIWE